MRFRAIQLRGFRFTAFMGWLGRAFFLSLGMFSNSSPFVTFAQAVPEEVIEVFSGIGVMLRIPKGQTFPIVMQILPGTAAAKDGAIRIGDKLIGVSDTGSEASYVSLYERPIQQIASLLRGPQGSTVFLRLVRDGPHDTRGTERVVRLVRHLIGPEAYAREISGAHGDTNDVPNSDPVPAPSSRDEAETRQRHQFENPQLPSNVQPNYGAWSKLAKGMAQDQVLAILGPPLEEQGGATPESTVIWIYGWLRFPSESLPNSFDFAVFLKGGKVILVEDPFGARLSPDGKPPAPLLILPEDQKAFDHYPRFTDFRWNPCSGNYPMDYIIQIETKIGEKWVAEEFRSFQPYFCFLFSGANAGRWRVRATNTFGEGPWSAVREFKYIR